MPSAMNRLCTRAVDFVPLGEEERASKESDGRTMEGYAAVFNVDTEIKSWEGQFNERIARGAFKKTIAERKPVLQFDHGRDARTGSVPIGAIGEIREDRKGLFVSARLFDNPVVEPIRQAIEGEAISGMSFRFKVVRDDWTDKDGKKLKRDELVELLYSPGERGPLLRTIREVELFEAGPVVFPAYEATSVGVRSDAEREAYVQALLESAMDPDEEVVRNEESVGPGVVSEDEERVQEPEGAAPQVSTPEGHEETGYGSSCRARRMSLLNKKS